ncbi:hypothetical protein ABPG75_001986 [Micractinium tetrahymenae]
MPSRGSGSGPARTAAEPAGPAVPDSETLPPELACPLCHELFLDPVLTPCRHAFCSFCIGRLFELRKPADVGTPAEERQRDCPLQAVRLAEVQPDACLDQQAPHTLPGMYAQREREVEQERVRLAARRLEHPRLYVGNLHSLQEPQPGSMNTHDWTFFVRMDTPEEEERFIERVVVRLHPTFRPNTVTLAHPPFAVRRLGWGYFVARADVTFREEWGGATLRTQWLLDFSGQGGVQEIELELEGRPGPGQAPGPDVAGAAAAATSGSGAAGGLAAAAAGEDDEMEEVEMEGGSEEEASSANGGSEGSGDEDEVGGSEGDAGGDYDLRRFVRGGRLSASPGTSTSEREESAAHGPAGEGGSDSDSEEGPDG